MKDYLQAYLRTITFDRLAVTRRTKIRMNDTQKAGMNEAKATRANPNDTEPSEKRHDKTVNRARERT
jgi:hypothetical protein